MFPFESIPKPSGVSGSFVITHALNWADTGGTTATNDKNPIREISTNERDSPCDGDLNIVISCRLQRKGANQERQSK
jgi:hypothetical protein